MVHRKCAGASWLLAFMAAVAVTACGGGGGGNSGGAAVTGSYTVSGKVTGLNGSGLVLQVGPGTSVSPVGTGDHSSHDDGGDSITINENGTFTFKTPVANGASYNVKVARLPNGRTQTCTVNNGSGKMSGANVTNVTIVCGANARTVSGTVSGLAGTGLVLQNNGADNLTINANGTFSFATPVASGANYNVTVLTQPSGPAQTCTVNGGTGMAANANVTNVTVTCSTNTYTVSGTVSGLAGAGLVLQNNGGDNIAIAANGTFTFPAPVVSGAAYSVTAFTQPIGPSQTCTVTAGAGLVTNANVTNVSVMCSTNSYTISGTVSGLSGTGLVLQNNGTDFLNVTASGAFSFTTPVVSGATYNVTVSAQPMGPSQTCTVTGGAGMVTNASITNLSVVCSTNTYTISGTVRGLSGAGLVLQNNGTDFLAIAANGAFTFVTPVASGGTYNVTASAQPMGPSQTCTAGNFSGSVTNANITSVTVSCSTNSYTIGGTVSGLAGTGLVLQDNGGDFLQVTANGPFTFATPVASGAAYNVSVATPPGAPAQSCTVNGGTGTVAAASLTSIAVSCVTLSPRFAFAADTTDNSVSSYAVDASTGRLRYIGKAAAGLYPLVVATNPAGNAAYVVNMNSNTVSQYTVANDGTLTPMVPATVATGTSPRTIAIDPTGRYAYVGNGASNDLSAYTIGATGALTPAGNYPAGSGPNAVAVDPAGKYVYAANFVGNDISAYAIGAGGALTRISCGAPGTAGCAGFAAPTNYAAGMSPQAFAIDPAGRYVYVANQNSNNVSQYTIAANGGLAPMAPAVAAAGTGPGSVAMDPAGQHVYVANWSAGTVSQYAVGATGALTPMTPATVTAAGLYPAAGAIIVDPSGKYAYVPVTNRNAISQFTIGAGGALTLAGTGAATPKGPNSLAMTRGAAAQPVAQYAYVANSGSNSISQYTIGAGGSLTPMAAVAVAAGTTPQFVAVDPSGHYAYVANQASNDISAYAIGANGALTQIVCVPTAVVACNGFNFMAGAGPVSIAIDPAGKYVYVANYANNNVSQYTIGAGGTLVPQATPWVAAGKLPRSIAIDPSGEFVYVANSGSNTVSQYLISTGVNMGSLVAQAPAAVTTGTTPVSVATDPYGQYLYVASAGGAVSQYGIGANGLLTAMATPAVAAGTAPSSVAVDLSAKYAYAANSGSNTLSQYALGAGGSLIPLAVPAVAAGAAPSGVTVDFSGKYVYVANGGGASLSQYAIGTGGALTAMPAAAAGAGPSSIATAGAWR